MATLALIPLVYLLYSCVPAVSSEPLVITITKDGIDEAACLSGPKVPCKTFDYASQYVDGNGGNVTIIITYPQQVFGWEYIYIGKNISSLIIVGQVGDDYTFTNGNSAASMSISSNVHVYENSPEHLRFENVHCTCLLTVTNIQKVEFKGYYNINPKYYLVLFIIASVTIEDSTLTGVFFEPSCSSNIKIKNSSLINNDTMLSFNYLQSDSAGPIPQVDIFIEYTNFTFIPASSPDQPPYMAISFKNHEVSKANATISKCKFFNCNSTSLLVDMYGPTMKDIHLSILDSDLYTSRYNSRCGIVMTQVLDEQANVYTRLNGNSYYVHERF